MSLALLFPHLTVFVFLGYGTFGAQMFLYQTYHIGIPIE